MPQRRRRHQTALQIPTDLIVRHLRSTPTRVGYEAVAELTDHLPAPEPAPEPKPEIPLDRTGPWTEEVYVSPSGRIFLPAGFDLETGSLRTLTRKSVRREPPRPRPAPRRAHVVISSRAGRARVATRESWVVPPHLSPR
ncbi:MAG: hypothetical protein AAGF11_13480 [Myxococcota bacterium]